MPNDHFLELLKNTAKEQSFLGQEKFIPDKLSDLANFVAIHLWQSVLLISFISAILLNLYQFLTNEKPI